MKDSSSCAVPLEWRYVYYVAAHVSPSRPRASSLSAAAGVAIEACNGLDLELYT
jgi:hypothetical protein